MNREELNWLLQTIDDAESAERFVLAQYDRGRISFQLMRDVSERVKRRRQRWSASPLSHRYELSSVRPRFYKRRLEFSPAPKQGSKRQGRGQWLRKPRR